jgi:hypothetical protein
MFPGVALLVLSPGSRARIIPEKTGCRNFFKGFFKGVL